MAKVTGSFRGLGLTARRRRVARIPVDISLRDLGSTRWRRSGRPTPERAGRIEGSANEQCSRKANCCRARTSRPVSARHRPRSAAVGLYRGATAPREAASCAPPAEPSTRPHTGRTYSSPPTRNSNTSPRAGPAACRPRTEVFALPWQSVAVNQTSEESRAQGFSSRVTARQECLSAGQRGTCGVVRTADPAKARSKE